MTWRLLIVALALGCLNTACSPTFNWRLVRPDGTGLQALFPCKPARHERRIPIASMPVDMSLLACTAGDVTFAIAFADVRDPQRVAAALDELLAAAARNVGALQDGAARAIQVPGMTPNARATLRVLTGQLDGQPREMHAAVFAKGSVVFQATVVGQRVDAVALEQFFTSLGFTA